MNLRTSSQFFIFFFLQILGILFIQFFEPGPSFLDILSLLLFVLAPLGGLYFILLTFIREQAPLRKALFISLLFSFVLILWLFCVIQNFWLYENPGEIVTSFALFLLKGNIGIGLSLSIIHGMTPIFIFYGVLHSSKKEHIPLLDPALKKTPFLISMYFLPLAIYLLILIAALGQAWLKIESHDLSIEENFKNHLIFFSGTSIAISAFISFFYLPASILYLKRTHQSGLKRIIDPKKLIRNTLIPMMILIPAANLSIFLTPGLSWETLPNQEAFIFLFRFVSAPLVCIVALALSLMKRRKKIGYWIIIFLAGFFSLINLSLLSLFLGFLIIYYSSQEMKHLA